MLNKFNAIIDLLRPLNTVCFFSSTTGENMTNNEALKIVHTTPLNIRKKRVYGTSIIFIIYLLINMVTGFLTSLFKNIVS